MVFSPSSLVLSVIRTDAFFTHLVRESQLPLRTAASPVGPAAGGRLLKNSYSVPRSLVLMRAKVSHGIADPGYWRPPRWKRAMNVSRSGNLRSELPGAGVKFGVLNQILGSVPGTSRGSMSKPPENSGPAAANVIRSRGV